ncbi:MAG: two-component regulator propeller domain-containing protein, partial [Bacteroidota bacterium]
MKVILKYFILFLFLTACKESRELEDNENTSLYSEPVSVTLDTSDGYTVNKITGDSIKPLINSSGDTIKTGIPVPLSAKEIISERILKPTILEGVPEIKTIIPANVHPIPDKLPVTIVDITRLKKVKLGEGDQSHILRNSLGVVPTGIPISITGKKMPFSEPHPVKAAPMRFKDNATASIQYLDVDQGLGYSYITAIYADKKGNIWFGLDGMGISKYDGINITTYSVKEGLTHNFITSIIEDRNNNLWFGTNGGITSFDGKNFTQYTEKEGLASNKVFSIMEDKKGDLWFITAAGLTKYDGNYFTNYTPKEGLPRGKVYTCIEDRNGNLWIGTDCCVTKFDGNSFINYTEEDDLAGYIVFPLLEDEKGNIWLGTLGSGVCKFDGKKFTRFTKKEGLSDNTIWSMLEDSNGNIWISTSGGGLNKYDGKNLPAGKAGFIHYSIEQGMSNNKVRGMTKDRSGNIWLATEGGGVNKINVTNFDYQVPEEVVENNRIRPIMKEKKARLTGKNINDEVGQGNLWFGTENANIGKLNAGNADGKGKLFTYYRVQDKLPSKGQRSLLQDKNGNIWIGTTSSGIVKYDGKNFTNYSIDTGPPRQGIYDMLEDKKNNIWFGARDGSVLRYDGKDFVFCTTQQGLPGSIIYSMMEDKQGNIWFCTEGAGIYKYDGTNLINYTEKEGLFSKSVTSITEDDKGNIWLGTLGSGVCKFDGRSFTYYTEQQGLSNNNVWSVFCDSENQLWFGTDKGLTLFIPQKERPENLNTRYAVYNFGSQDGLKAIDFNLHSVCVDDNNHIWWGTGKGAPSFDLSKGFHADSVRSLSMNYIEINNRFYDFRNLSDSAAKKITFNNVIPFTNSPDKLSLSYDLNHLTFHFSAIDWSAPDKIKYSYRMVGLDEKWSKPSEETIADYRNLSYDKYQFQVKAIGQSQVWTAPFTYQFTILPAWWQTWWFRTLIIMSALVLVFFLGRFIYYYQLRKEKIALEKQLAVQYERQRISTEMHDDIGAGLSGVRLLTEMTKSKLKDTEATSEMDKIYQSVGDISSKMKEVIWSLNAENDDMASLISFIQKQARDLLQNYPGDFTMEIPEKIPEIDISGEARRNIYLAVKEALHNIIKHSGAGKIDLTISCNEKMIIITVSDNGKGFK